MESRPKDHSTGENGGVDGHPLSIQAYGPRVRPEVARILAETELRIAHLQDEIDRATAEFNRPRGIMGKLFGLRTHVG